MSGPAAVGIPASAPGQTVDIPVNLVAPGTAGEYTGVWRLRATNNAIFGGYTVVTQDALPFSRTVHERGAKVYGVNVVGLRRRGFTDARIEHIHQAVRLLTQSKLNTSQALEKIRESLDQNEDIEALVRFVETAERGVIK